MRGGVRKGAAPIEPLDHYLRYALAVTKGDPKVFHDPAADEQAFLIDTDGKTYGQANTYEAGYEYGNLFLQRFGELLDVPARRRTVDEARQRMQAHCTSCPYYGHCPGLFAAEATAEQRRALREEGCQVRELIAHILHRLAEAEVVQQHPAAQARSASH